MSRPKIKVAQLYTGGVGSEIVVYADVGGKAAASEGRAEAGDDEGRGVVTAAVTGTAGAVERGVLTVSGAGVSAPP